MAAVVIMYLAFASQDRLFQHGFSSMRCMPNLLPHAIRTKCNHDGNECCSVTWPSL